MSTLSWLVGFEFNGLVNTNKDSLPNSLRKHTKTRLFKYSGTSLSRTRLFQITAYLEVKIWSLF